MSAVLERRCAAEGCSTILSRYRPTAELCSTHEGSGAWLVEDDDFGNTISSFQGMQGLWPDWTVDAACKGSDILIFDVEPPSSGEMTDPVLGAKRICAGCPVRETCLAYGFSLDRGQYRETIYGGLTGRERMAISRHPDRLDRGRLLFEYQRAAYWLDPVEEVT